MATQLGFIDQKIGQVGSNFDRDTINMELDLVHDRLNRIYVEGVIAVQTKIIADDYTLLPSDSCLLVNTTEVRTIRLPPAARVAVNKVFVVKDALNNATSKNITVYASGDETIDKSASKAIAVNSGVLRIFSTGVEWFSL